MALQTSYADAGGIPEKFRELYSRSADGTWILSGVEGIRGTGGAAGSETELAEIRADSARCRALCRRLGRKPEELETFAEEHEKLKTSLAEATGKLSDYSERLRKDTVEKALRSAAAEAGIRPEAVNDVLARAAGFEVNQDNRVCFRSEKGEELTPAEWLGKQLERAPHWLAPSRSAGARGFASASRGAGTRNPVSISDLINESWNKTRR